MLTLRPTSAPAMPPRKPLRKKVSFTNRSVLMPSRLAVTWSSAMARSALPKRVKLMNQVRPASRIMATKKMMTWMVRTGTTWSAPPRLTAGGSVPSRPNRLNELSALPG